MVLRRRGLNEGADFGTAGERGEVDARMAGERGTGFLADAGDHVERPFRKADLERERGEAQRGEARVLRRLDHAGIAHRERSRDRAAENLRRIIPRDHVAGDAVRLAEDRDRVAVEERDGFAVHLVGGGAVELEITRRRDRVRLALLERLAGIAAFKRRDLVLLRRDCFPEPHQQPAAFERGEPAPGAGLERVARRRDRGIDFGRTGARHGGERLAVGRANDIERPAIPCGGPFAGHDVVERKHCVRRLRLALQRHDASPAVGTGYQRCLQRAWSIGNVRH
jgi:hypothetical protein